MFYIELGIRGRTHRSDQITGHRTKVTISTEMEGFFLLYFLKCGRKNQQDRVEIAGIK